VGVLEEISREYQTIPMAPILELINLHYEMVSPKPIQGVCRDPDDDKFLAAALSSGAKYIVSGDKALLELDLYQGISVMKPGDFIKKLK
jgi:putative PIN family toxin of toxin-antitoxin system